MRSRSIPNVPAAKGPARLLGRILESEAISTLAVTGGLAGLVAVIELLTALAILAIDPAGRPAALLLAGWLALSAATAAIYLRRRRTWTQQRLTLTEALLEAIAGQRTRHVQQTAGLRDDDDQHTLTAYDHASERVDRVFAALTDGLPRGWLVAALATLAITADVSEPGPVQIAAARGAILLAFNALRRAAPAPPACRRPTGLRPEAPPAPSHPQHPRRNTESHPRPPPHHPSEP